MDYELDANTMVAHFGRPPRQKKAKKKKPCIAPCEKHPPRNSSNQQRRRSACHGYGPPPKKKKDENVYSIYPNRHRCSVEHLPSEPPPPRRVSFTDTGVAAAAPMSVPADEQVLAKQNSDSPKEEPEAAVKICVMPAQQVTDGNCPPEPATNVTCPPPRLKKCPPEVDLCPHRPKTVLPKCTRCPAKVTGPCPPHVCPTPELARRCCPDLNCSDCSFNILPENHLCCSDSATTEDECPPVEEVEYEYEPEVCPSEPDPKPGCPPPPPPPVPPALPPPPKIVMCPPKRWEAGQPLRAFKMLVDRVIKNRFTFGAPAAPVAAPVAADGAAPGAAEGALQSAAKEEVFSV